MRKHKLGKDVSFIYRYSQMYYDHMLKDYGLGSGQYIYLVNLFSHNGINQRDLSNIVKMDKTTTTRAVAKLIEQGYVTKQTNETDKRAYNLYTTPKAEAMKDILMNIMAGWNNIMLSSLDDEEIKTLIRLMDKVSQSIESSMPFG